MSKEIEQRILEMQFDNKQFESGIQTSMKSLEQFERGLQLDGAANGLNELDRAAKSFSFGGLANSVDAIASKFTALGIIGVTALQNIGNELYRATKNVASALTIDPVKTGFSEYETQINAVQTILANTQNAGKTLPDVTKALDELNAYADKTIYNFTEMTRNIGTFTAAGVDLDVATNSIQGIANLAAISGSTSQQASTAMYQLSQAMAAGTVKLMDWNSVVNAGMGGQVFQDALKETARAHGVAIDDMIEKYGSFRETLQKGWITTDVLTETLEKFTATTEGLTEEQIQANREMWKARGYTEEQIDAIFEMGKTATDAATKVKTFTQLFDTLKEAAQSGWTQSWEILIGDFEEAKYLLTQISDEIGGIINQSSEARNNMLQGWKDAGGRDDLIEGLRNVYQLLCDIVGPAKEAFDEIFPPMQSEQLKEYTQAFEDFTTKLKLSAGVTDKLKRTLKGFFAILDIGAQGVGALASGFADLVGYSLPIGENLLDMTASLGDFLVELSEAARETDIFTVAMDTIGDGVAFAADAFEKLTAKGADVFRFFSEIDLSGIEVKIEPLKALGEAGAWVLEKLQEAYEKALPFLTEFGGYASDVFGDFSEAVSTAVQDGSFKAIMDLVNSGLLGGLIVGITKVAKAFAGVGENAGTFLENLSGIFEGITGALEGMQSRLKADALKSIATAIGILAISLAVLSTLDGDNLGASFAAITAAFAELLGALFVMTAMTDGVKMGRIAQTVSTMKGMATAVLILSAAMSVIGKMDTDSIGVSLASVLALMGMLVIAADKLSGSGTQMMKGAGSLIAFATAIGVLALSMKMIGSLDLETLGKGLVGLGLLMAELALFMKVYDFGGMGFSTGAGILAMSVAMLILSSAIKSMGEMDIVTIAKGLLVMASALCVFGIVADQMPGDMIQIGVGLMAIASALVIVGAALHIMGNLDIEQLVIGLLAMAGSLTAMVVAANMMKGSISGAAAMLVMAGALVVLGGALKIMGSLSMDEAITALTTLGISLVIVGGAAALLAPIIPAILGLAVGILALGAAIAVGGAGLLVLSAALTAAGAGVTAFAAGIVAAVVAVASAIPVVAEQLGLGILAIANAISAGAPACEEAVTAVIQAIVNIVVNGINSIVGAVGDVGPALLKMAGFLILLAGTAALLQPLVPAIISLSVALGAFGASCAVIAVGVLALAGALELLGLSGLTVAAALTDIYNSIESMGDLSLDAVLSAADLFETAGEKAAKLIMAGLKSGMPEVVEVIESYYDDFYQAGVDMVRGLVNGMDDRQYLAVSAAASLGNATKNAMKAAVNAHSPSRDFEDIGMWIDMGLANGVLKFANLASDASERLGQSTIQPIMTMTDSMIGDLSSMGSALRGTADMASDIDSTITSEQYVTVKHSFDDLTVKGVNDQNELVAVADYSVEELLTDLMRKGSRR